MADDNTTDNDTDLQTYSDRILSMDPIEDVPSTGGHLVNLKNSTPSIEALAPEHQREIQDQLFGLSPAEREEREPELVRAKFRQVLAISRGQTGVGETATQFHKEMSEIAGEFRQMHDQIAYFQKQLDRVHFENRFNDQTGKNEPVEVPSLSAERRRGYAANIADLKRRQRLLMNEDGSFGIEGAKRLQRAMDQSARTLKRVDEERAIAAEAKRRAAEMVREERINTLAHARAKMLPGGPR